MPQTELSCPRCGEISPTHFAICWNCGESLENAPRVESAEPEEHEYHTPEPQIQNIPMPSSHRWRAWIELTAVCLVAIYPLLLWTFDAVPEGQRLITANYLLLYIPERTGLAVVFWFLLRHDRFAIQPAPIRETKWFMEFLIAVVIFVSLLCLRMMVVFLAHEVGIPKGKPSAAIAYSGVVVQAFYGVGLLFFALYEEVVFRVYLQSKLQSLLGGRVALSVILSAALFAVVHDYSLSGTLAVFRTGIFYGAIYQSSRKVPRLVLAHWMHNLFVMWH